MCLLSKYPNPRADKHDMMRIAALPDDVAHKMLLSLVLRDRGEFGLLGNATLWLTRACGGDKGEEVRECAYCGELYRMDMPSARDRCEYHTGTWDNSKDGYNCCDNRFDHFCQSRQRHMSIQDRFGIPRDITRAHGQLLHKHHLMDPEFSRLQTDLAKKAAEIASLQDKLGAQTKITSDLAELLHAKNNEIARLQAEVAAKDRKAKEAQKTSVAKEGAPSHYTAEMSELSLRQRATELELRELRLEMEELRQPMPPRERRRDGRNGQRPTRTVRPGSATKQEPSTRLRPRVDRRKKDEHTDGVQHTFFYWNYVEMEEESEDESSEDEYTPSSSDKGTEIGGQQELGNESKHQDNATSSSRNGPLAEAPSSADLSELDDIAYAH